LIHFYKRLHGDSQLFIAHIPGNLSFKKAVMM